MALQIFYLAEIGKQPEVLRKSVFIEKLHARGYEVLLLTDPIDELFVQNMRKWQYVSVLYSSCTSINAPAEAFLSRTLPSRVSSLAMRVRTA